MSGKVPPDAPVQRLDTLRSALAAKRDLDTPWREIARSYPGVPPGTLCAIYKGREPKSAKIRAALGLPTLAPAPVCPQHGVVHVRRCRPAPPEWVMAAADWLDARRPR